MDEESQTQPGKSEPNPDLEAQTPLDQTGKSSWIDDKYHTIIDLLEATGGIWDWEFGTNQVIYSAGFREILGFEGDDVAGLPNELDEFERLILKEDRGEFMDRLQGALANNEYFVHEFRMLRKDGKRIWVRAKAVMADGESGNRVLGTLDDISRQRRAEEKLIAEQERLKTSNDNLQQFAYIASHDLQEPLRAISGYVSLLKKKFEKFLDKKAIGYISKAVEGARRLQVLIQDLLKFAGIIDNEGEKSRVRLNRCVDYACRELELLISESNAELEYDLPEFLGNEFLLRQLFQNLISNSIKYRSRTNPMIRIYSQSSPDKLQIFYEDNGIGIPGEYHDQVFRLFRRLHQAEEYSGTGIGLAICSRVVECHNGVIHLDPDYRTGCRFVITLPIQS